MRIFLLLLLIGCAQTPMKFQYSSSGRRMANVEVKRMEITLQADELFASGIDSTFIQVKLFDSANQIIKYADPDELNISSSEDIEAKPFVNKAGVFQAEIMPRFKSPEIQLRVDWRGQLLSQEVTLKTTMHPLKDNLEPLLRNYPEARNVGSIAVLRGTRSPEGMSEGFFFKNTGNNRVVNSQQSPHAARSFSFEYPEQARQNLALQVDDAPNGLVSHTMHSIFMIFPRKYLPTIEQHKNQLEVKLPTGEKMLFHKDSKEIMGGVFSEGPVDVSQDRFRRHYPHLIYKGRGVILRVNARGQSPKLGQFETNKIDMEHGLRGSVDVLIINNSTGQKCRRPKADFWEPLDVSPVEFKFPTDEEFDLYLRNHCGFGLPRF
jgi:hypothetical protein